MLSVNNQRRPVVDTNVTPSVGIRRPSTEQDSPASNSNSLSASPTFTGYGTPNGRYSTLEVRSRSSSASSVHSLGGLSATDNQLEQKSQQSNSAQYDKADALSIDSPTNAVAASLIRRDHITGHTHDRSRSASIDGEIEQSAWSLEKVLEWLDDNSFSNFRPIFEEQKICGEQFFALCYFRKNRDILRGHNEADRYRLINAIRKIGDARPKRQSLSEKNGQPTGGVSPVENEKSPIPGSASTSSLVIGQNSPTTQQNHTILSLTHPIASVYPISAQGRPLKTSSSFPDLRNSGPIIKPRTSSIGWDKNLSSNLAASQTIDHDAQPNAPQNTDNGFVNGNQQQPRLKNSSPRSPVNKKWIGKDNSSNHTRARSDSSESLPFREDKFTQNNIILQVTENMTTFYVIDVTGLEDSTLIKDRIFSQFNIEYNDRDNYAFHVTEIGKKKTGPSISDEELVQKCMSADDRGTLKLLVRRMRPQESSYGIPSQTHKRSPSNTMDSSPSFNSGDSHYRRPAPYPPHSEIDQISPPINNEEQRRFPNFTGGFNPRIQDRWNVGVISEEPSDTNKFKDFQDVRFPVPHIDQPGGQISAYPTRHRKTGSGDQYRSPNRGGSQTSQKSQRIHPPALQPGRRSNALLSAAHGSGLYPRKLSKSQPNLPLYQTVSANFTARLVYEPEQRYQPMHPVISEPDLARRGQVILPESEEKPLWPKITSLTDNEVSLWAEEPKPTLSIPNDHDDADDGIWAEEPKPTSSISNDHDDADDGIWAEEPKPTSSISNDDGDADDGIWAKEPKPTSSISNDNDDADDGIWAKEPKPTSSTPNDHDDADDGIWAKEPKPTSSIPNDHDDADDGIWAKEPKPTSSIADDHDNLDDGIWAEKPKPSKSEESSNDKQSTVLQRPDLGDSAISLSHDTPFENHDQPVKRIDTRSNNSNFSRESKSLKRAVSQRKGVKMEESWIERPNAEDMYEDLEQYFPGHDLDMPIAEAHGSVQSVSENGDSSRVASVPEKPKISRGKSIRVAASEARERERRERKTKTRNIVNTEVNEKKLARRSTTKLWGRRVVEERPSSKKKIHCPHNSTSDEGCAERKPVKWVKGELIGKGSFGKVYLAINLTSSEILAVKQIKLPKTKMDQRNERQKALIKSFKDEMEILKDLDYDHIVTYIGYEENDDTANIFLEYVNGGSIGTVLRMYGAFEEPVVRSFTRQILLGLKYLHKKNILHRDIKADNILVDEEGCCKISDFGISKKYEHGYGHDYNSMSLKGTIFWMAPEVFTNNYSVKMDIWSLGCVVLEMFAGERPWSDLEDLPAMYMLGTEKKAPPIREDIVMSDDARDFLNKCFIIEPNDRPTAKQLLFHPFAIEKPGFRFKDYIKIPS